MQSKAATVPQYLAALPDDRRAALSAVRDVILANLDRSGFEEGIQYGMIGYFVPHRVYPAGYHVDPRQPLPFAALASQKGHMSLYLLPAYAEGDDAWLRAAWEKTGKKLDMGKSCIRFKKLDDLALDVVAEAIRRVPAQKYIAQYEQNLAARGKPPAKPAKTAAKTTAKTAARATAKTASTRATAARKPARPR
jgi:hypothetical protein